MGLSLVLVVLAVLIAVVELVRHHAPAEAAALAAVLLTAAAAGRWLARDLRAHPANFPDATAAHNLGRAVTATDGRRPRSRWASLSRIGS